MCNVFEVAKKICEAGNWEITNLKLQKMLYIAQVLYIGKHNGEKHLFRASFEAWDYGPVVPLVYHTFKIFGNKPIQKFAFPETTGNACSKEESNFINTIALALSKISASNLVALTHRKGSGWDMEYTPGVRGNIISEKDMLKEYKNIWTSNEQ